jgi:RNA polymerase sigma-70 factor (ECF subfamily)
LHKVQDHYRAAARVQHLIDEAGDSVAGKEPDPADQPLADERRATIRRVMDDLPEPQRLALEWKYLDHLSVREIAERMATTEKAVESILFRARREFRERLDGLHGGGLSTESASRPGTESPGAQAHHPGFVL